MALFTKSAPAEFTVPPELQAFYSEPTPDEISLRMTETFKLDGTRFDYAGMQAHLRRERVARAQTLAKADAEAKARAEAERCTVCGYPFSQPRFGFRLCSSCEQLADSKVREQRLALLDDVQKRQLDDIASRFIADHP